MNRLGQAVTSIVPGVNHLANELTAIGITVNADGTLAVNNTTLNQALSGQLTGISANDVRRLLEVLSTLTPSQVGGSPEGSVTITQGLGAQLGNLLNQMLDPVSGQITLANQTLQNQASAIAQTITQQQQSMQQQQQALLLEFSNMESTLAELQSAGNALNNSLTSITLPTSSTSSTSSTSGTGTIG